MAVGLEPARGLIGPAIDDAGARVLRLGRLGLAQPHAHLVAGSARASRNLASWDLFTEMHLPDLGQHVYRDHLCIPCSKVE